MTYDVTYQHPQYKAATQDWQLIDDVCAGERRVKEMGVTYLPMPNPADTSPENKTRYDQYVKRAVFYNATGRTKKGLIGAAFRKAPTLKVPESMAYIGTDIDGKGISIYQQSQKALDGQLKNGRCGLLADYPRTAATVTKADQQSGNIRATCVLYNAKNIRNWQTTRIGSKIELSLVVIMECISETTADGFGQQEIHQYRILRLLDGIYQVEIQRKNDKGEWYVFDQFVPLRGDGLPWLSIPFTFLGSENNDDNVDDAPLLDLATLNIAHYRNSADYEDSVFFTGQPQAWIGGLDEAWRDWLQENKIYVGARAPLLLPKEGAFGFAQPQPNSLVKEAMTGKEQQMVSLGARLIQPGGAQKTATEDMADRESEMSVLSLCVSNNSEAYTQVIRWMAVFENVDSSDVSYEISSDFVEMRMDAQLLTALIALWQSGKYPEADLWAQLRKYGLIRSDKTDEEIKDEVESTASGLSLND